MKKIKKDSQIIFQWEAMKSIYLFIFKFVTNKEYIENVLLLY